MRVRLTSLAEVELLAALEWYTAIRAPLPTRFLDEYESLVGRLRDNPWQFPVVRGQVRRAGFNHFPYALLYRIHPAEVEIIACFHGRRDPRGWQTRN